MYDPGDYWSYTWTVKDSSGNLADATAFLCTLTLPDGTSASIGSGITLTKGGAGLYVTTYGPLVQPGRYAAYAQSTGTNAAADQDEFDVRAAASIALISLPDARASLNFTSSLQDDELRIYIDAATDMIEQKCGPLLVRTVSETVKGSGSSDLYTAPNVPRTSGGALVLTVRPVLSIASVTAILEGGAVIDPANLVVDGPSGIVRRIDRGTFYDDYYTVVYTAGRLTVVPEHFRQAARDIIKNLWSQQRSQSGRPGQGSIQVTDMGSALTPDILRDLEYDLKTPGIA